MKKNIVLLFAALLLTLLWQGNQPTNATSAILKDFSSLYGEAMANAFSCQICHTKNTFALNLYGQALAQAGAGNCGKYNPPSNHDILESSSTCSAYHRSGYRTPLASNCWGCHGSNLQGESAPSCYACHDKLWQTTNRTHDPDFDPPPSHNKLESEDGLVALHEPGLEKPYGNGCNNCHGSNLRGGTGPSCYTCHGDEWSEDDDSEKTDGSSSERLRHFRAAANSFRSIENEDSDGDGFTNIEEIRAVSNPGDSASIPGGSQAIELVVRKNWNTSWLSKTGSLKFQLIFNNKPFLDISKPVTLSTEKLTLQTNLILKKKNNTYSFTLPKALLAQLFLQGENRKILSTISGYLLNEDPFSLPLSVKIAGSEIDPLPGIKAKFKNSEINDQEDLVLVLRGQNLDELDDEEKIILTGLQKRLKRDDYELRKNRIVITLEFAELEKIFGTLEPGINYPLGIVAKTDENDSPMAILVNFTYGESGGGGESCYNYNPPATHSVARTSGKCTYMHSPGFAKPAENGCNACHGADLKGSSFAPSCFQCHAKNW